MVVDFHSISDRRRNHFSGLLNVPGFYDVRKVEIHTVEPLIPESSAFEV